MVASRNFTAEIGCGAMIGVVPARVFWEALIATGVFLGAAVILSGFRGDVANPSDRRRCRSPSIPHVELAGQNGMVVVGSNPGAISGRSMRPRMVLEGDDSEDASLRMGSMMADCRMSVT